MRIINGAFARVGLASFLAASTASIALAAPIVVGKPIVNAIPVAPRAGVATTYYGGGATLPALAYQGTQTANPGVAPVAGSLFAYFVSSGIGIAGDKFGYCQTGSGFGKRVLIGGTVPAPSASLDPASKPCAALGVKPVDGTNGFGAPAGRIHPDFAGSDAPISQSEYSTYYGNFTTSEPVQVPYVVGAIAMAYKNSDTAIPATLTVTEPIVCQMADGEINNWHGTHGLDTAINAALGTTFVFAAKALHWVARSDGSGTTFSFANNLSKTCRVTKASETFALDQNFFNTTVSGTIGTNGVLPNPNPGCTIAGATCAAAVTGALANVPTSFYHVGTAYGASGNSGVATAIAATDGAFGYVEAANAKSSGLKFASLSVSGKTSTALGGAAKAANAITTVLNDQAIGSYVQNGRPAVAALTGVLRKTGCVKIVDPTTYSNITTGYPYIAVSYLLFNQGAANADLENLAKLTSVSADNGKSVTYGSGGITSIDKVNALSGTTGYSSLSTTLGTNIATTISSCI